MDEIADLDITVEFPDMPEIDRMKLRKMKIIAKDQLNLKKTYGIPNWFLFHLWNLFVIFNAVVNYLLYNTTVFGHYNKRKGVLSTYLQIYLAVPIAILYTMSLCAGKVERIHIITWLFKYHVICVAVLVVAYFMDGLLYIFDNHAFCTL